MPPKKRDKDLDSTKNPRIDHIQADHELFLQAFESKLQVIWPHTWKTKIKRKHYFSQNPPKFIGTYEQEICVL